MIFSLLKALAVANPSGVTSDVGIKISLFLLYTILWLEFVFDTILFIISL